MRFLVTPFGSRGDVQPLLALGHGLCARGHEVVVGAAQSYRGWVEAEGFPFREIGGDVESFLRSRASGAAQLSTLRALSAYMREELPLCFRQTCEAADGMDFVVSTVHVAARSAAEAAGIPCRTVLYTAQMLPSRFHPPPTVRWQGLPGPLNRMLWWVAARAFDALFRSPVNRERRRLGLGPVSAFLAHARGRDPIVASDPVLAHLPADARDGPIQTGALQLPARGALPAGVEAFLAGDDPVYVGFGSTPDRGPEGTTRLILEALHLAGRRAILGSGWAGLGGVRLPPDVITVEEAPHALLFSRVAAVVHHGGAGTTATALRAGAPQVVVPHLGDQFFHGRRIRDLGIGLLVPRRRLTAGRLAAAIRAAAGDGSVRERARDLAGHARQSDGAGAAIDALLAGSEPGCRP